MARTYRSRVGLGLALVGALLMMLGGIGDVSIRRLLPGHLEFLGYSAGEVPAATEALVLALLHALGAALTASGLAVLVLLHQAWRTGRRLPALSAAAVALLGEGMNAAGMYRIGSRLFAGPLACLLLVTIGVVLYVLPRREPGVKQVTNVARTDAAFEHRS